MRKLALEPFRDWDSRALESRQIFMGKYRRWLYLSIVVWLASWISPLLVFASEAAPDCRLDDELAPAVRIAARWGLEDLKKIGLQLPFDDVAINPRGAVPTRTLGIQVVKDAAASTVDERGCIKPIFFRYNSIVIPTDGPCLATQLDACTSKDREYMEQRFQEIHGGLKNWETGYEMGGACYMTNLHACLYEHRLALLDVLGPRDARSVKGTCIANAREPAGIQCSAGALKLLLSSEAVADKATTIGMVLVLGHELAHLASGQTSSFDAADNVIDLAWKNEDKITRIQNQCRTGESLRKRERDADEIGLSIARRRLPQIASTWPKQGTTGWLVTQAIHQSTNLMRWNDDWSDREAVEVPRVFRLNTDGGVIKFNGADIDAIMSGTNVSGRTPHEVDLAARRFLCDMTQTSAGIWNVLMQSGSTHGTMTERLGELVGTLRSVRPERDSPMENLEAMTGGMGDLPLIRHRAYLSELEGAICTVIERPLDCSIAGLRAVAKPSARENQVPANAPQGELINLPLNFITKGPYREVAGDPRALTIAIGTFDSRRSLEEAVERGNQIAVVYAALFSQIDDRLHKHGGYWVNESHTDVEIDYNQFSRNYMVSVQMRAVAQVPPEFPINRFPALQEIRKWGRADEIHMRLWREERHEVVIHFFRYGRPGATKDSQRVITNALRFDQIFNLEAALAGKPNQTAAFFRDLLPFLHQRLKAAFGGAYTLEDESPPSPFYIISSGLGENFYLPADWQPLIDSGHVRLISDAELAAAVNRAYIDNSREQNVAAIFRGSKP